MTYIVRVDRGKSIYLYECRSVRPDKGMDPVSDRVYIGRVDKKTREFIPKRYYVTESFDVESWEFRIKELPKIPSCHLSMALKASSRVRA